MTRFDRFYPRYIQLGLVICVWFGALAHAGHDLWAACSIFAWLTFLVLLLLLGHFRTKQSIRLPCVLPAALLMMTLMASTFRSYDVVSSCLEVWMWFFCFVAFYLLINTIRTDANVSSILSLSSAVLIPLSILCMAEQMGRLPERHGPMIAFMTALWKTFRYGHWEISATLINSIVMSGFALFWFFFLWEQKSAQVLQRLSFISIVTILILGRSSWAYVSLGLGLIVYFKEKILSFRLKRKMEFAIAAILAILCCVAIVYFKFGPRQGEGYEATNRIYWWLAALKMIRAHPLTGIGPGSYAIAYPYFRIVGIRNTLYAHSFPLQFAAEAGFLGLMSLGWLTRELMRQIQSSQGSETHYLPTRAALIATVFLALAYGSINISLEYFLNKLAFFLILGCLVPRHPRDIKIPPGLWSVATAAILILLVPLWITPLQASRLCVAGFDQEVRGQWAAARNCYADAIQIDRTYADAYAGMARTYKESYRQTHSAADLVQWRQLISQALSFKKDIRYLQDLNHPLGL